MFKHHFKFSLLLFFICQLSFSQIVREFDIENSKIKDVILKPDSLLKTFNKTKAQRLKEGDTLKAINILIKVARAHTSKGNFAKAYNDYWEALYYSNKINDSVYITNTYRGLGLLYSFFGRSKEAEKYYDKAVAVIKERNSITRKDYIDLANSYYAISGHHRDNGNFGVAQQYLDSCRIVKKKLNPNAKNYFLQSAQGYVYSKVNKLDEALDILVPAEAYFKKARPSYLIILYSFMGEVYAKKKEFNISESFFLKSLENSKKYNTHQNYTPKIYQNLADLYLEMGKLDLAYENLKKSKEVAEKLFGARSENNIDIIEIEDSYRKEREEQRQKFETAKLEVLEQKQENLFLQNAVLIVSIIALILLSVIVVWNLNKKRAMEKKQFILEQKIAEAKNAELLDFKNKELTSSALQLVQKDELISQIRKQLTATEKISSRQVNQILAKIKLNKGYDWKEFNARFASVNKNFYNTLSERYPKLTQRDHRLCALIKLNFTSKEIAQLLGISVDSVNTSRYRLRKKMNLTKEEDLSEVIMAI